MLPKAHLTSHSGMSGSRWVTIPSWLSRSLRSFLYSSSVYSYHLFLISSASVRSLLFMSFIVPIFAWNIPLVSPIFRKRFLVFPIVLFSSTSLHRSFKKAFLSLLAILWNSSFSWIYLSFSSFFLFSFVGEFWQKIVHWRREWQTTSLFLPWEPHEQYEKTKRYDTERWMAQVDRCPICYWIRMKK